MSSSSSSCGTSQLFIRGCELTEQVHSPASAPRELLSLRLRHPAPLVARLALHPSLPLAATWSFVFPARAVAEAVLQGAAHVRPAVQRHDNLVTSLGPRMPLGAYSLHLAAPRSSSGVSRDSSSRALRSSSSSSTFFFSSSIRLLTPFVSFLCVVLPGLHELPVAADGFTLAAAV